MRQVTHHVIHGRLYRDRDCQLVLTTPDGERVNGYAS